MSKRCRLIMPSSISSKHLDIIYTLKQSGYFSNDLEIKGDRLYLGQGYYFLSRVPSFLIHEIKEPETRSEIFEECYKNSQADFSDKPVLRNWFNIGWKKRGENERKKHEPKQSFSEVLETGKLSEFCQCGHCSDAYAQGWDACEENRGYNE